MVLCHYHAVNEPTTDFIIMLIALVKEPSKQAHQNSPKPELKDVSVSDKLIQLMMKLHLVLRK